MVLLFAHQNSARLHYIIEEVVLRRLGIQVRLTHSLVEFQNEIATFKIAYAPSPDGFLELSNCVWMHDAGLLFEDFVRAKGDFPTLQQYPITQATHPAGVSNLEHLDSIWGLFPFLPNNSASLDKVNAIDLDSTVIPFDLFSAIFWCLTRYEEVQWGIAQSTNGASQNIEIDAHGRYPASESLFAQNQCLEIPLVDQWTYLLGHFLGAKPSNDWSIVATADIDMALRYGGRTAITQLASLLRDLIKMPQLVFERLGVLLGKKDPYAMDNGTLDLLKNTDLTDPFSPKLFLLTSAKRDQRNKQIGPRALEKEFQRIKKHIAFNTHWVGIHPSWQEKSNAMKTITAWEEEKQTFSTLIGDAPKHSRFHFIHMHLPQSYQLLLQLGIQTDWSMGYPDAVGFRAGTAVPFHWYDLIAEKSTPLKVVPFCIMDVTCKNYLNLSHDQSIALGLSLKQTISSWGGVFCFIFHNESVSDSHPWKGWKNVIVSWSQPLTP
ncbi:MAG: DUF7033 domain-containing protein [Bacteroidota bacterium]